MNDKSPPKLTQAICDGVYMQAKRIWNTLIADHKGSNMMFILKSKKAVELLARYKGMQEDAIIHGLTMPDLVEGLTIEIMKNETAKSVNGTLTIIPTINQIH